MGSSQKFRTKCVCDSHVRPCISHGSPESEPAGHILPPLHCGAAAHFPLVVRDQSPSWHRNSLLSLLIPRHEEPELAGWQSYLLV